MSPRSSPAFQWYPADFLADQNVALMGLPARGAYISLLSHCWLQGSLPADTKKLARLCGVTERQFKVVWPEVEHCFVASEETLRHKRLDAEREKQESFRQQMSTAGKKGAETRWRDHGEANRQVIAMGPAARTQSFERGASIVAGRVLR